jgi:Fe-S cluster assembly iron-binding protein IscA
MIYPLEVTKAAASYISDVIAKSGKKHITLECLDCADNGHEYKLTTTDDENGDIGIRLNAKNVLYLNNDTAKKMYASVIVMEGNNDNKKLSIMNPNIKGSCDTNIN